jgi:hypothetical protein
MRRPTLTLAAITGCLASSLLAPKLEGAAPVAAPPAEQATTSPRSGAQYGELPMAFEPNQGQSAREVRFLARGPGYDLLLTPTAAVLTLHQPPRVRSPATPSQAPRRHPAGRAQAAALTLQLKLLGANPQALIRGEEALPGKVNYPHGKDPKGWRTNIPTYRQVKYAERL